MEKQNEGHRTIGMRTGEKGWILQIMERVQANMGMRKRLHYTEFIIALIFVAFEGTPILEGKMGLGLDCASEIEAIKETVRQFKEGGD